MDFVLDQLVDQHRLRNLTILGNLSCRCITIHTDQSILGADVVDIPENLKTKKGEVPARIQVDNGSEFITNDPSLRAYDNNVALDYSKPAKPTDNSFIMSFNESFLNECFNVNWFLILENAQETIESGGRNITTSDFIQIFK